jgi:excisionase family DNA binding protein
MMMGTTNINDRAPNRVPKGNIRLSEAFELLYRRLTPDWETLEHLCVQCDEDPTFDDPSQEDPYRLTFNALSGAEATLRNSLQKGELRAFVHNADTGVDLELLRTGWLRYGDEVGIFSDYTDTKTPGPDCAIDDVPHPIFLQRIDFDRWLARWEMPVDKRSRPPATPSIEDVETFRQAPFASRAFSVNEVIERTGLSKTTLYEAIADRKLRARKFGLRTLILETDLDAFLRGLPATTTGDSVPRSP